jgi:hypothetical protein
MPSVRQTPPLPLRLNPVLGPHGSRPEALTHCRPLGRSQLLPLSHPGRSAEPHPTKGIPQASRIAVTGPSLVTPPAGHSIRVHKNGLIRYPLGRLPNKAMNLSKR